MSEKDTMHTSEEVVFRNIVCGVIYNQDGLLLLGKRPSHRGVYINQWGIIGGGIDEGESEETALLREIEEEAGLTDAVITEKIDFSQEDITTKLLPNGTSQHVHMRMVYYVCQTRENNLHPNEEWEELRWMDKKTIKKIVSDLNDPTRELFKKLEII